MNSVLSYSCSSNAVPRSRNILFVGCGLLATALLFSDASRAQEKKDENVPAKGEWRTEQRVQNLKPLPREKDAKQEEDKEGADFLKRRQDWLFKPRAFPLGFIPRGARERALQQKSQMFPRQPRAALFAAQPSSGFLAPASLTTAPWASVGPQPTSSSSNAPFTSGRVTALAVNPNNANNVYLGAADGGLWASTDGGGTWTPLTDNPPNAANIPTVAVGAIAVDPTTCGAAPSGICTTVYVGTGEDNFGGENIYGEGVLNCTVAAGPPLSASCTQDTTFHTPSPLDDNRGGPMIGALAVNRAAGKNNILLAGVRGRGSALVSGIYCSADKGATWTRVLPAALVSGAGDPGTDVAFASDGTAWAALGFIVSTTGNGIYKSSAPVTSCSITWNQQTLPAAFTASKIGRITLGLAPSSDATIYAAIADASTTSATFLGVVRSLNANTATPTWTQLSDPLVSAAQGFCTGQCFYDMALAVDPANPAIVYAGGSGQNPIIRSTTGTTTAAFSDVTSAGGALPHVDTHAFAFAADGSKVWVGNDGGVWSSSNAGAALTWSNLNGPAGTSTGALNITQFYPGVSIHPSNPGFALGGSQDNGIQVDQGFVPATTSLAWLDSGLPCDGGFTVIDPNVPSTSYGECEYLPSAILVIGVTFAGDGLIGNGFLAVSGIDGTDRGSFIPPLVVDQKNSQNLYFGTCRVWQTKDGANSWNAVSPDITTPTHPTTCPEPSAAGQPSAVLSTIAVAPSDSNTIYAGSDQGEIEVTSNGGTAWASIITGTLPARAVTQVIVDPLSPATAYATFSGFGTCNNSAVMCDGKGHVFKTVNGTSGVATWVDISGTATRLPDIPVNAIVLDPDDGTHNTLYVGTDIGAFFTTDGGVNWAPLGASNSMPNAQILSLVLHNPSRTLRAATHGRGVWDLNLGPGPNTPALVVSKLSPFSANAPGAATTLTVTGTGFTGSSVVMWNGTTKTTTFASATQLTAPLTTADLASGAVVQVDVVDGATTSNSLPFTVLGQAPTITSVSPTNAPVNSTNTPVTVTGTNFNSASTVILNPDSQVIAIPTTFTDATHLSATVPASFMANFGSTNSVGVKNPPPGGGLTVTTATVTLPTFVVVAPPPANDNFASAITVTSPSFSNTKDSSGATTEAADPTPACSQNPLIPPPATGRSNTIWYKFVPTSNGMANLDTIGSSYDSVLSVWSGTSQTALSPVACNDDINPGIVTQSQLTGVSLSGGTTYFIMVSSFGQADPNPDAFGGKTVFNFSFTPSPDFTLTPQAPTSMTVNSGSPATYTVAIAGTNGFSGNVSVSCALSAASTTCSANPASVASGSSTTITVSTTAHQLLPPIRSPRRFGPVQRVAPTILLMCLALALLAAVIRTRRQRLAAFVPLAGVVIFLVLQAIGCSGGGGGTTMHGTQAGTYTVTVTGTSGGTTHTATVTLIVN